MTTYNDPLRIISGAEKETLEEDLDTLKYYRDRADYRSAAKWASISYHHASHSGLPEDVIKSVKAQASKLRSSAQRRGTAARLRGDFQSLKSYHDAAFPAGVEQYARQDL